MTTSEALTRPSAADQILATLRGEIAAGVLARGERLPAEKNLARRFGVSGPTVREAVRGLSALGLVQVRHGSGTYVAPDLDAVVASSLSTVVELEHLGLAPLISLLDVLNRHAAELAVERATSEDLAVVRDAAHRSLSTRSKEETGEAVTAFLDGLVGAAHDPLLGSIARFLVRVVVTLELGAQTATSEEFWAQWAAGSGSLRLAVVEALEARDRERAVEAVRRYHQEIAARVSADPAVRGARLSTDERVGLVDPSRR